MTTQDAILRLNKLTVGDLMNPDVITVSAHRSMADIAAKFVKENISAAPVVDDAGRLVGMLSATDFLHRDCECGEHHLVNRACDKAWEITREGPDMACAYMTGAVQTVAPSALLLIAALMMTSEHVHHLPVVDSDCRVIGMISTMDIVAATLNIANELNT